MSRNKRISDFSLENIPRTNINYNSSIRSIMSKEDINYSIINENSNTNNNCNIERKKLKKSKRYKEEMVSLKGMCFDEDRVCSSESSSLSKNDSLLDYDIFNFDKVNNSNNDNINITAKNYANKYKQLKFYKKLRKYWGNNTKNIPVIFRYYCPIDNDNYVEYCDNSKKVLLGKLL